MTLIVANMVMFLTVLFGAIYIGKINCDRAYEKGYTDCLQDHKHTVKMEKERS